MGANSSKEIRDRIQSSNYHYNQAHHLKNNENWYEALHHFHNALNCYEWLSTISDIDKMSRRVYVNKIEEIKREIQAINDSSSTQNRSSQIQIRDGETGHTYESLFSNYMDNFITEVYINDAYIQKFHQIRLFLGFCEFLVKTCPNLQKITLTTKLNVDGQETQKSLLSEITRSLKRQRIVLSILYSNTIHDREIRLNNGWFFILGRGLDFYKPPGEKGLYIGNLDMSLRKCKETTITILHT
uniref:MITD1 C-terminal phospholipase D-like domain-containing protein n=1 Tax=Lepeophtheirus salmonis TaxID=72036 RepID=A0A0K2SYV8_LEPSM